MQCTKKAASLINEVILCDNKLWYYGNVIDAACICVMSSTIQIKLHTAFILVGYNSNLCQIREWKQYFDVRGWPECGSCAHPPCLNLPANFIGEMQKSLTNP